MGYTVKEFRDIIGKALKRSQPSEEFTAEEVVVAGADLGIPAVSIHKEIADREQRAREDAENKASRRGTLVLVFTILGIIAFAVLCGTILWTTIERDNIRNREHVVNTQRVRLEESLRYRREILSHTPSFASQEGADNRVHIACTRYETARSSLRELSTEPVPTCSDIINRSNHQ